MKRCGKCKRERDASEFGVRDKQTGRRHTICIACRREYWRAYYYREHADVRSRQNVRLKLYRARNRAITDAYLSEHPCVDCGERDPVVLEFDHVRGAKRREVSTLVRDGTMVALLLAEIAKCDVRCANCHRRKTARDFWSRPDGGSGGQVFSPLVVYYGHGKSRGDCSSAG